MAGARGAISPPVESVKATHLPYCRPGPIEPECRAAAIRAFADDIIGQHFSRFYESAPSSVSDHELTLAKANVDSKTRLSAEGRDAIWTASSSPPLFEDPKIRGFAKVPRDLTTRVRYEDIHYPKPHHDFSPAGARAAQSLVAPHATALDLAARSKAREHPEWVWTSSEGKSVTYPMSTPLARPDHHGKVAASTSRWI